MRPTVWPLRGSFGRKCYRCSGRSRGVGVVCGGARIEIVRYDEWAAPEQRAHEGFPADEFYRVGVVHRRGRRAPPGNAGKTGGSAEQLR